MRFTKRLSWIGLVAASLMLAATVSPAFAATPVALESLTMRVQQTDSVMIVSGEIVASAKLPVTISLPIPSGAKPYWVGEIIGTDPSKDPQAAYTVEKAKGYDLAVFTLKQGRTGQVEVSIPGAVAGAPSTLSYSLPIASKVALATLTLQLPVGSTVSSSSAGLVASQGASGEPVLTKAVQNPKLGSSVTGSATYTGGAGTGATTGQTSLPASPGDTADALALPLWILVIVLGGLFAGSIYKKRADARRAAENDEDEDEDDEDENEDAEPRNDDSAFDDDAPAPRRKAAAKKSASNARPKPKAPPADPPKQAKPRKKD